MFHQETSCGDFLGGPVLKNLPCNAGDLGSIPGWETKIPHAMEQEALKSQLESPRATRKDKIPHDTTKIQCSQINKYF